MGLVVVGFIIGFILFVKHLGGIDCFLEFVVCFLVGLFGALLAAILALVLTCAIVPSSEYIVVDNEQKIIALKDNQGVAGSHFLFSGAVDSELKYYYATESDFGIHINSLGASRAYIRSDDNPRIQTFSHVGFKHWYTWLYAFPANSDYYIFYVPDGTVERIYKIDLE